jgi:hypothetical protein
MPITRYDPNTIFLGGKRVQINDLTAGVVIRPGHLVERYVPSGSINRWKPHATAGAPAAKAVATDQSMGNLGVDNDYAIGDLVEVSVLEPGGTAWMLIASGQNIAYGARLESAGDGTLRTLAAGTALFVAIEAKPTVATLTRIRVEAL